MTGRRPWQCQLNGCMRAMAGKDRARMLDPSWIQTFVVRRACTSSHPPRSHTFKTRSRGCSGPCHIDLALKLQWYASEAAQRPALGAWHPAVVCSPFDRQLQAAANSTEAVRPPSLHLLQHSVRSLQDCCRVTVAATQPCSSGGGGMDFGSAHQTFQPASSGLSLGHSQPPGGPPAPQITIQREGAVPPLPTHAQNQLPIFLASAQPHQPVQAQHLQHQAQYQHQGFGAHQGSQLPQQSSAQSHLPGHQSIIFNMQQLPTQTHTQPQSQPQPGPSLSLQAQPPQPASQTQAGQPAGPAQESAPQELQPAQAGSGHRERDNFGLVC